MAGHSKFKNIMYRKGAQDAKRSKQFSKLSTEITVAAKVGGPDPDGNPRLRLAVQNTRSLSMPKDNIERAVKKAEGGEGDAYEEIRYEGYGPGGVAIIVEALTDNRNRTASTVRSTFGKNGGALGETGSVAFMFDRVGEIVYGLDKGDADSIFEAAIDAGAEDVNSDDEGHTIICAFGDLGIVARDLEQALGEPNSVKPIWKPQNTNPVDAEKGGTLFKLVDLLEDDDDIQNVYTNVEISEEDMAIISEA